MSFCIHVAIQKTQMPIQIKIMNFLWCITLKKEMQSILLVTNYLKDFTEVAKLKREKLFENLMEVEKLKRENVYTRLINV